MSVEDRCWDPSLGRPVAVAVAACGLAAILGTTVLGPMTGPAASGPAVFAAEAEELQQNQTPGQGALVAIQLPIPGGNPSPVMARIERAVARLLDPATRSGPRPPILVLELAPRESSEFGEGLSFTAALEIADQLVGARFAGVKTVAYLPESIKGHGVLIAMACQEIVMAPGTELGEAGIDEGGSAVIKPHVAEGYRYVAEARRTLPTPIALGMLDPSLEVLKVFSEDQVLIVTGQELEALRDQRTFTKEPETIISAGTLGSFSAGEARRLGFVKYLAESREELATRLDLPPAAVIEDQSLAEGWNPVALEVSGPLNQRQANQLITMLREQRKKRGVNWVAVRINSNGGDIDACLQLAIELDRLPASEIRAVAYVVGEARGGAAIIALACDQLVMQREARLGGEGFEPLEPSTLEAAVATIQNEIAVEDAVGWSTMAAMIDPQLEVYPYRHTQTGRRRLFSPEEASARPDADLWGRIDEAITAEGKPLELSAERAKQLTLAWQVVQSYEEFIQLYDLEVEPRLIEPNWALELVEALASPGFAVMLLVVGFVGIYIELQAPGIGLGGFVACVAFLLFFWSKFLHGTAEWLEVLMFVGGICFILLELFVLPGFGVFGIGGGLMIFASLILASQTFILPESRQEMDELRDSLLVVTGSAVGIIISAMLLRRFLPHAPMFNRLLLNPMQAEELADLDYRESITDYTHLIGQLGVAATDLRPSGKASFGGELLDVISDGDSVDRGTSIQVVETRGNRVVVRAHQV